MYKKIVSVLWCNKVRNRMSILTKVNHQKKLFAMRNKIKSFNIYLLFFSVVLFTSCQRPKEEIVLRQIKDVVVDATSDPLLKANAIFFNPNDVRGKLKR